MNFIQMAFGSSSTASVAGGAKVIRSWSMAALALMALSAFQAPVFAQSASSAPTAAQLAAAKAQAAVIGTSMQNLPQTDAQGNVQVTPTGQVATTPSSNTSRQNAATLMQNLVGKGGFQGGGDDAATGQTFGGTAANTTYVDIPCALTSGSIQSAGGVDMKFGGCDLQNGTVSGVQLSVCTAIISGGDCTVASNYSATTNYPAGQFTSAGTGASLGVGCNNTTRVCRVTVTTTNVSTVQAAHLSAKASDQQSSAPNTTQQALSGLVSSQTYQQQMTSQQSVVDCYSANQNSYNQNGTVSNCAGTQTVALSSSPSSSPSCNPQPTNTCSQPTSTTQSYTTSCTREFPITTYSCSLTTPSLTCTVTTTNGVDTNSCTPTQLTGGTLVSQGAESCTAYTDTTNTTCATQTRSDVYVFQNQATNSNCAASPLPLAGPPNATTCSMATTNEQVTCQPNGWVGRTLPDQECQVSTVGTDGSSIFTEYTYANKQGCGYCANNTVGYSCQGVPAGGVPSDTCQTQDLSGCTLSSVQAQSSAYGLTTSQLETYSCSKTVSGCAAWVTTPGCMSADASYGESSAPVVSTANPQAFTAALTESAVADSVAQSGKNGAPTAVANPLIFNGNDLRCRKPLGFISGVVTADCCDVNLTKTGGAIAGGCTQNEVTLAAARRANFTVYIGTYCSVTDNYVFFTRCDQQTETYCAFQGILPRLIQVQGRQQLQQMSTSAAGSSLKTDNLNFAFYAGSGGWTAPITVNGIQVSAYQQPSYCASTDAATAALTANPNLTPCPPTLNAFIAACEATTCGALPTAPQDGGTTTWTITSLDPLQLVDSALSPHAVAKGGCDTGTQNCVYEISAWPAASGGRAIVSRNVTFSIYAMSNYSGGASMAQIGAVAFSAQPVTVPAGTQTIGVLPATIPAQVSTNSGSSWTNITLPTQITSDFTLPGTDVTVTGGCIAASATCDYTLVGSIEIEAKPWGSAQKPDCTGFTLDQFSALNISKMDLSEWISSVESKINAPNTAAMVQTATAQAATGGTGTSPGAQSGSSAIITPTEAMGPFTVTLSVTGNWTQMNQDPALNTDPVTSVHVDWGDCTATEYASELPTGGYSAQHLYKAPNTTGMCSASGPVNVNAPQNLTHKVLVTLVSTSGTHQLTLSVSNDYVNYN